MDQVVKFTQAEVIIGHARGKNANYVLRSTIRTTQADIEQVASEPDLQT